MGRCFPTLFDASANILLGAPPKHKNVELNVVTQFDPTKTMCLGPHCQCWAKEAFHKANWASPSYRQHLRLAEGSVKISKDQTAGSRLVKVPLYACMRLASAAAWHHLERTDGDGRYSPGLLNIRPRFHLREKDMQAKLACALCTASWSTLQHCLGEAGQAQETAQESVEGTR